VKNVFETGGAELHFGDSEGYLEQLKK
jgi:hypothetical protein